jgi:hypothetical protein
MTAKQRHSFYNELFNTETGRLVVLDLCEVGCVMKPTFDINPQASSFNEGRRAMVLHILKHIHKDPNALYAEMLRNNQETTHE